ncbi:hypothetical protein BX616_006368, partial [Lobosporangium transversale]
LSETNQTFQICSAQGVQECSTTAPAMTSTTKLFSTSQYYGERLASAPRADDTIASVEGPFQELSEMMALKSNAAVVFDKISAAERALAKAIEAGTLTILSVIATKTSEIQSLKIKFQEGLAKELSSELQGALVRVHSMDGVTKPLLESFHAQVRQTTLGFKANCERIQAIVLAEAATLAFK